MPGGRPPLTEGVRIVTITQNAETERLKLRLDHDLMRDLVGLDIQTKLLLVALGGTALGAVLDAYEEWKKAKLAAASGGSAEDAKRVDLFGFLAGLMRDVENGVGSAVDQGKWGIFGLGGIALDQMFDRDKLAGGATAGPYAGVNSLIGAAKTTAGLAWAALFASIIFGKEGVGGILGKIGAGASDAGALIA